MQDLHLSSTPTCSPMLLIDEATFGLNQTQIDDMIADIQKQLGRLYLIMSRKKSGLAVTKEQNEQTRLIPHLEQGESKRKTMQKTLRQKADLHITLVSPSSEIHLLS